MNFTEYLRELSGLNDPVSYAIPVFAELRLGWQEKSSPKNQELP